MIMQELLDRTEADECIAPYLLGNCYEDSLFVQTDYEQSTHYYIRSAARGFFPAMEKLGAYYLQVKEDSKEGILWYFRAAEIGSDDAWYPIGLNIFFNNDVTTVVDILIYCAEKGSLFAQFLLARRYETGNGIEENITMADYWRARIAKYGNSLEDINTLIEANLYTIWGNIPKY